MFNSAATLWERLPEQVEIMMLCCPQSRGPTWSLSVLQDELAPKALAHRGIIITGAAQERHRSLANGHVYKVIAPASSILYRDPQNSSSQPDRLAGETPVVQHNNKTAQVPQKRQPVGNV